MDPLAVILVLLLGVLLGGVLFLLYQRSYGPDTEDILMRLPDMLDEVEWSIRVYPTSKGKHNIMGFVTGRHHNYYDPTTGENRTRLDIRKIDGTDTWEWGDFYDHIGRKFENIVVADGNVYLPLATSIQQDDNREDIAWFLMPPNQVEGMRSHLDKLSTIHEGYQRMKQRYNSLMHSYTAYRNDVERMSMEIRAAEVENAKLSRTITSMASERNRLREEVNRLQEKVAKYERITEDFKKMEGVVKAKSPREALSTAEIQLLARETAKAIELKHAKEQSGSQGGTTQTPRENIEQKKSSTYE